MPKPTPDELALMRANKDVAMYCRLAKMLGHRLEPGRNVLDFGCGHGTIVLAFRRQGIEAHGVDVKPRWNHSQGVGSEIDQPGQSEVFSRIDVSEYRFPYESGVFDFVFSNMVLEHVQNYKQAFAEISRVLHPDGFSLHVFPSRNFPIELHSCVPLATRIRSYPYLRLWAALGLRNSFQKGFSARNTALINLVYLRTRATYYSMRKIRGIAASYFGEVEVASKAYGRCTHTRKRHLYRLLRLLPGSNTLGNTLFERVIVLRKPKHSAGEGESMRRAA